MSGFSKYLSVLVYASFTYLRNPSFLMHMHLYFFFFLNSVQFFLYVTWLAVTLSFDN